jgi:2-methylcitrate dehydratase PrpD
VQIETFDHAVRLGNHLPRTTEEAQYAIGFPVAAFLVNGQLGAAEISDAGLRSPQIAALCRRIELKASQTFTARFPAERIAIVTIEQTDGTVWASEPTSARGDPDKPLPETEIVSKFRQLTELLSEERRVDIERAVAELPQSDSQPLRDAVLAPLRRD